MKFGISGAILAGGDNKRFSGITKSRIVIDGEDIISRIVKTISFFFDELIIVTNTPSEFHDLNRFKIIRDYYPNTGPLGGIHAALKASTREATFVFAGDMPFIKRELIQDQINEFIKGGNIILVPRIGDFIEPLHAIYSNSVLKDLENFILNGESRSVRDFLGEMDVGYLQIPESEENKKAFTNINSPADLPNII